MDALAGRSQTTRGIWLAAAREGGNGGGGAPASPPSPPLTLVLDLEGADGRERGEDDASFERQTALFAMAVADVLVVNMWAKDVGREAGAGKPLLRTIFGVDLKLRAASAAGVPARAAAATAAAAAAAGVAVAPSKPPKKVLLFAFRDRTRTPLPTLAAAWAADLEALWGGLAKPAGLASAALSDFFDVQYTALPNFEDAEEAFRVEAAALRARFDGRAPGALRPASPSSPCSSSDRLPGSALPLSLETMWEVVQSQRDLNLPAHKVSERGLGRETHTHKQNTHSLSLSLHLFMQVMVANLRCAELGDAALAALTASPAYIALTADAASGSPLPDFGARAAWLVAGALSDYDADAAFFEPGAAADRRADLAAAATAALAPAHERQLEAAACGALDGARAALMVGSSEADGGRPFTARAAEAAAAALAAFDAAALAAAWPATPTSSDPALAAIAADAWPVSPAREALEEDVASLAAHLTAAALADAEAAAGAATRDALTAPATALLDAAPPDLWPRLARLYSAAVGAASDRAVEAVGGYGHGASEVSALRARVASFGRGVVEARAREAARAAIPRLKERWADVFSRDEAGLPRSWAPGADVAAAAAGARGAAAALLGALAALRLPAGEGTAPEITTPDAIDRAVVAYVAEGALPDGGGGGGPPGAAAAVAGSPCFDLTSATAWPAALIPPPAVLLTPDQVRAAWAAVQTAADRAVRQALATVEARAAARGGAPPLWAVVAIAVLGADELLAALRSPLRLALILLALLFARTVYVELGVDEELSRGLLPGCISLAAKAGPVVRGVTVRTLESVVGWAQAARAEGGVPARPYRGGFHPLGDAAANGNGDAAAGNGTSRGLRQRRAGGGAAEVEMVGVE